MRKHEPPRYPQVRATLPSVPGDPTDDSDLDGCAVDDSFEALLRSAARTPAVLRAGARLGDGRFTIVRALGHGGMGAVYEAHDQERGQAVALKTLVRGDPQRAYRLKHEFRALSEVVHPNLVALHEFFSRSEPWFFTMDLVRGQDFLDHVLGAARDAAQADGPAPSWLTALRAALSQLALGVDALHAAGKLHCDLKPSNVMVTGTGQLRILDFGLVSDVGGDAVGQTLGLQAAGTPNYMAPEQFLGQPLAPATDYYAVGVMLYEALAGRRPFERNDLGAAARTLAEPPKPLSPAIALGPAADLARLCLALLSPDPAERPGRDAFLRGFGVDPAAAPRVSASPTDGLFVGREREQAALRAAWHSLVAHTGPKPVVAWIEGPAGIGKSQLAARFVAEAGVHERALVLHGRCFARESVPFNAFDRAVDALSRELRRLPAGDALALWPDEGRAIGELFPVLQRVESFARTRPLSPLTEPLARRRRAFSAFASLLVRLSRRRPLLLSLEDMQWADDDSLTLLQTLLSARPAPDLYLLLLVRPEPGSQASALSSLCEREASACVRLSLGPLSQAEAQQLLTRLGGPQDERATALVARSAGNPSLLQELVAAWQAGQADATDDAGDQAGLETLLQRRAAGLGGPAWGLLQLLSVATRPLELGFALFLSGLQGDTAAVITRLCNAHWLRLERSTDTGHQTLSLYHERARDVIRARLAPAAAARFHRALAGYHTAEGPAGLEAAAAHWSALDEPKRECDALLGAAAYARDNLAFASAARCYRRALGLGLLGREQRRATTLGLAETLACGGRARAAAGVYLQAAAAEAPDAALALRCRATQLLLASGALEEGSRVLRRVLREVGLRYPEPGPECELELQGYRALLASAGYGPGQGRSGYEGARSITSHPELRRRYAKQADACIAASALGPYDHLRALHLTTAGLRWAIASDDPLRIARALSAHGTAVGADGQIDYAGELVARAEQLLTRDGTGHGREQALLEARAHVALARAQWQLFSGRFRDSLAASGRAEALFREGRTSTADGVPVCQRSANMALYRLGRWPELVARSRTQLTQARDAGDRLQQASLRTLGLGLGHLLDDDLAGARREAELATGLWPQARLHRERFKALRLLVWCDVYAGDGQRGLRRLADVRAQAEHSQLLASNDWHLWWQDLTALAALTAAAEAASPHLRDTYLQSAEHALTALERAPRSPDDTRVPGHRSALAYLRGQQPTALTGLGELAHSHKPLLAASARLLRAKLGSDHAAYAKARDDLRVWVKAPDRFAAFLLPGFVRASLAQPAGHHR